MTIPVHRLVPLVIALAVSGCANAPPDDVESETAVPVTVAPAAVGRVTATVVATGVVSPAPGAELVVVAPEAGRLAEVPKGEGDTIHRGEVLVRFEIPTTDAESAKQRAEIARARARIDNARAAQTRAKDLFARGVAARKEVEDADRDVADGEADLATAQAAASSAEAVAGRSVVHAPFDGLIARRYHNPGDQLEAAASDPVLRLIDPKRLEVVASVSIADAMRLHVGAPARVVDAAEGTPALEVVSQPAAVQPGTGTVSVRLSFTSAARFPVGTPLQIAIDAESRGSVTLVPVSAIVREGSETSVFVVKDQKAQARPVKMGLDDGMQVEIVEGIQPGEVVITGGQNGLPDGATVSTAAREAPEADHEAEKHSGATPDAKQP